jgi:hypothetical protein
VVAHFPFDMAMDAYQLMSEGKLKRHAVILLHG